MVERLHTQMLVERLLSGCYCTGLEIVHAAPFRGCPTHGHPVQMVVKWDKTPRR